MKQKELSSNMFGRNLFNCQLRRFDNESEKKQERRSSCRRKLREKFDECDDVKDKPSSGFNDTNGKIYDVLTTLKIDETRRVIRRGIDRISKTFTYVKTTFDSISQRFKMPTRRRHILHEGAATPDCATPHTFSKRILGRTPTKLYSPFSIESPYSASLVVKPTMAANQMKN